MNEKRDALNEFYSTINKNYNGDRVEYLKDLLTHFDSIKKDNTARAYLKDILSRESIISLTNQKRGEQLSTIEIAIIRANDIELFYEDMLANKLNNGDCIDIAISRANYIADMLNEGIVKNYLLEIIKDYKARLSSHTPAA